MRSMLRFGIMNNPALEKKRLDNKGEMHAYPHLQIGDLFFTNPTKIRLKHFLVTIHIDRAITRNPHLL
jgi:hypothetical protein